MANAQRLHGTMAHVLEHPEQHDQQHWITILNRTTRPNPCGTTACFAGWAALLYGPELGYTRHEIGPEHWVSPEGHSIHVRDVAMAVLDLNDDQANNLFAPNNRVHRLQTLVDRYTEEE